MFNFSPESLSGLQMKEQYYYIKSQGQNIIYSLLKLLTSH